MAREFAVGDKVVYIGNCEEQVPNSLRDVVCVVRAVYPDDKLSIRQQNNGTSWWVFKRNVRAAITCPESEDG